MGERMVSEEVEKKLYNAASSGDLTTLVHLLHPDPYLVHGVLFPCSRNLLHIAAMHGQTAVVGEVLERNPRLARSSDSQKSSPLHIAATEGHVEIARKLLSKAPKMCWWRDEQGMNPVHVAAMNGHVEILELLLVESCLPAMERLHRGQTVLHLCVKHDQTDALMFLVEKLGELVCAKDDDGETLLHLAVRCNQLQTILYLVEYKDVELETRNGMGKTALQILDKSHPRSVNYVQMKKLLTDPLLIGFEFSEAIPEMSSTMIVVAVLIATMAFQSAINPAGGVWNEDDAKSSRKAGEAVMASTHPHTYNTIMTANYMAFVGSLIAMFLFTIKKYLAVHPYFFISMSFLTIGSALIAILITFLESMDGITPDEHMKFKRTNTLPILMAVLVIFIVVPGCIVGVENWYESWFIKKRRQLYSDAHAFLLQRTDQAAPAGA